MKLLIFLLLLSAASCKTIKCREFYRRHRDCTHGTSQEIQLDEKAWVESCEDSPEEILSLECNHKETCADFLRCVSGKK
jgi:hypothetical protein